MSAPHDDLGEAVAELIQAWLSEQGGGIITGFNLIAEYVDSDGDHAWTWAVSPGQRMITTTGLATWMDRLAALEQANYLNDR